MEQEVEKTKVCSIFEPTYRSIMLLPKEETRLRMFVNLCNYAFDEIEPQFGNEPEEKMLQALWTQFMVVFTQAKKRAKINAINGRKGGRPRKKPNESDGFFNEYQKKPTNTFSYSSVGSSSSAATVDNYDESRIDEEIDINIDDDEEVY